MKSLFVFRLKWIVLVFSIILGESTISCSFGQRAPSSHLGNAPLLEKFSWKNLDWVYPDEKSRRTAIKRGDLIPGNALPVGFEVWRNKLFLGVPRWRKGVPATLNYISLDAHHSGSPKLTPYPNWRQNIAGACGKALTTVHRMHADKCNRLWILDTGTIGFGDGAVRLCPITLNVFDLTTDKILRRYRLRKADLKSNTFISNIAVDVGSIDCEETFAYMPDEKGFGLIVYDWKANKSWRLEHSFFYPDPLAGDYKIGDLNFQWPGAGVFGVALSPIDDDGYRTLFFHPLSSNREFSVSTKYLRNEALSKTSYHKFQALPERIMGHSTSEIMDENGIMLFNLIDQNAIGCWNSSLPYSPDNHAIIARHKHALIFPVDIKIVQEVVWVMSNRLHTFVYGKQDSTAVNFRILTVPLRDAIAGTICQKYEVQQQEQPRFFSKFFY